MSSSSDSHSNSSKRDVQLPNVMNDFKGTTNVDQENTSVADRCKKYADEIDAAKKICKERKSAEEDANDKITSFHNRDDVDAKERKERLELLRLEKRELRKEEFEAINELWNKKCTIVEEVLSIIDESSLQEYIENFTWKKLKTATARSCLELLNSRHDFSLTEAKNWLSQILQEIKKEQNENNQELETVQRVITYLKTELADFNIDNAPTYL